MQSWLLEPNSLIFRRRVVAFIGISVALLSGAYLPEQPYLVIGGIMAMVYILTLSVNFKALAWMVIAMRSAALIVPFFPGRPYLWELCAMLAWPSVLVYCLLKRGKLERFKFSRYEQWALTALVGFVFVLVALMIYRGVGFRVLGGEQMGGRFYIQQVILAILPLLLLLADFDRRTLVFAVTVGWLMSVTYMISDFAFSMGGDVLRQLLYFFELPGDAINFEMGYERTGLRRFQSLAFVGYGMLAVVLTMASLKDLLGRKIVYGLPLLLGACAVGIAGGHRTMLVTTIITVVLLSCFQRFWNVLSAILVFFGGIGFIAGLYLTAPYLPFAIQRSISILPGIEISNLVEDDAAGTLEDRWTSIKLAINDVPDYMLYGRGFGIDQSALDVRDLVNFGAVQGYASGFVSQGTLGLLITTGLPGLLCTLLYVYMISRLAIQVICYIRSRADEDQSVFDRICMLLCAQWFSSVFFFYVFHGDAVNWMQQFGLSGALIMSCRRLLQVEGKLEAKADPQILQVVEN